MNLVVETYFNNALFREVFSALESMEVSPFDCLLYIHEHTELYTPKMGEIVARFIKATSTDLYDSYEEAVKCASQPGVIQKYIKGELGINELLVHRAELYQEMEDIALVLFQAIKSLLQEKRLLSQNVERYFKQLVDFTVCRKKEFYHCEETWESTFDYDFKSLEEKQFRVDPRMILPGPQPFAFQFYYDAAKKKHIRNALALYTNTPSGLGRLIQKSNMKKMYRNFDYCLKEIPVAVCT